MELAAIPEGSRRRPLFSFPGRAINAAAGRKRSQGGNLIRSSSLRLSRGLRSVQFARACGCAGFGGIQALGVARKDRDMPADMDVEELTGQDVLRLSADIVAAYVSRNPIQPSGISDLVRQVYTAIGDLGRPQAAAASARQKPATPISRSVQPDYIICLEDGARLKMLKRYLRSRYDMSPEDYRRKWGLPADYPMVAPSYAARRSDFAKQIGLGKGVRRKKSAKG